MEKAIPNPKLFIFRKLLHYNMSIHLSRNKVTFNTRQSYVIYSLLYHAGDHSHPLRQYKNKIYFQEIKWRKHFQIQNYVFSETAVTLQYVHPFKP